MATIHDPWRDDVNGIVIGEVMTTGVLMYEDRHQSQSISDKNDFNIIKAAEARRREIMEELGDVFSLVYPDDKWWVKIYNY